MAKHYVIETWRFILDRFEPALSLGTFDTEADALRAMWSEIRSSGKDMSRFRVEALK